MHEKVMLYLGADTDVLVVGLLLSEEYLMYPGRTQVLENDFIRFEVRSSQINLDSNGTLF